MHDKRVLLQKIDDATHEGKPFALVKITYAPPDAAVTVGDTWIVLPSGSLHGKQVTPHLAAFIAEGGRQAISNRQACHRIFTAPGNEAEATTGFFFDSLTMPESLVIAGGGHIAVPLTGMAARTGFRVTIIDDRPEFSTAARFPQAYRTVTAPFRDAFDQLVLDASTYVVIITRGHAYDRECLERVIDEDTAYIGMIGSRRRVRAVFDLLAEQGIAAEKLAKIHSPIGLDIGAQSPAEIAVSIVAELVAVRRLGSSDLSLARRRSARQGSSTESGG